MMSLIDDDDLPQLSAETYAALQEFYAEERKREEILLKLEQDNKLAENIIFDENWQLSQFWYNDETVQALVKVVRKVVPVGGSIALISCPTLFTPIKRCVDSSCQVILLEYDRRFEVHSPNFVFYDYKYPEKIPPEITQSFDLIIADPPFLSAECLENTSKTIKLLAKDKIILCTGSVMKEKADELLSLKVCNFQPKHRNNLANEFSCYSNFDLDSYL